MSRSQKATKILKDKKKMAKQKALHHPLGYIDHYDAPNSRQKIKAAYRESSKTWRQLTEAHRQQNYDLMLFYCYLYERIVSREGLDALQDISFLNESRQVKKEKRKLEKMKTKAVDGMKKILRSGSHNIKTTSSKNSRGGQSFLQQLKESDQSETRRRGQIDSGVIRVKNITNTNQIQKLDKNKFSREHFESLNSIEYYIRAIRGDGNCAFRAIAQGMAMGHLTKSQEEMKATELRSLVCSELRENRFRDVRDIGITLEELVATSDLGWTDYEDYVKRMEGSAYAGEIELILISRAIGVPIYVYNREMGSTKYKRIARYQSKVKHPPVFLIWHQGISEAGNHYNLLLKSEVGEYDPL